MASKLVGAAGAAGARNTPEPAASYQGLMGAIARILEAGKQQPARAAFLSRALNALADVAPALEERSLETVAGAPSDHEALLRALQHSEALAAWRRHDPLAEAKLRGVQAQVRLLAAEGGALTLGAGAAAPPGAAGRAVLPRGTTRRGTPWCCTTARPGGDGYPARLAGRPRTGRPARRRAGDVRVRPGRRSAAARIADCWLRDKAFDAKQSHGVTRRVPVHESGTHQAHRS